MELGRAFSARKLSDQHQSEEETSFIQSEQNINQWASTSAQQTDAEIALNGGPALKEEGLEEEEEEEEVLRRGTDEIPTSDEAYRFFTSSWADEPEESTPSPGPAISTLNASGAEEEVDDGGGSGEDDEKKVLVSDLLNISQWNVVKYEGAIYRPFRQQLKLEKDVYFVPPYSAVSLELKLGEGKVVRNVCEEGLYVGKPAVMSERNRNKMEQRLVKSNDQKWFGEDGLIKSLADTVDENPPRPSFLSPSPIKVIFCPPSMAPLGVQEKNELLELVVEVSGLVFTHHHLFSREHVLASTLFQLEREYQIHRVANTVELLWKRLELVRAAVSGVRGTDEEGKGQRLAMYRREIKMLRQRLEEEEKVDRNVLKAILKTWMELKTLREVQGYTCTTAQLKILKKESNIEDDKLKWQNMIDSEVRELKKESEGSELPFDETEARQKVTARALASRRHPGEPNIIPELSQTAVVTKLNQCPKLEQKRRADFRKCEIFIKVYYNDKQVTQTALRHLNEDFTVSFGEIFNLRVSQAAGKISLKIFEKLSGLKSSPGGSLVAEVYLGPPVTSDEAQLGVRAQDLQFSNEKVVKWDHQAVGSGELLEQSSLFTTGSVTCGVRWAPNQTVPSFPALSALPRPNNRDTGYTSGRWDLRNLRQWVEETHLDPNNPDNALLFHHLQDGVSRVQDQDYFRLDHLQREFDFTSKDDFLDSPRFRMIRLREKETKEFRNLRMIPMYDREVDTHIFQLYESRLTDEKRLQEEDEEDDDVDDRRRKVLCYLSKVREEVWWKYQLAHRKRKQLSDIVVEEDIPNIGALGSTIYRGLTEKRRPLRPTRKDRRKVTYSHNVIGTTVTLLVNVANAFNVPIRKEKEKTNRLGAYGRQPTTQSLAQGFVECPVRPVVEVAFQQQTACTGTSSGPNPCWNQDLQLQFRAPNDDLSPGNLQTVKDSVYFNLFDQVAIDMLEDERDRESHIHQRIEKKWLGSLKIPFSTLYLNTRIEGTFRMDTPSVLMGYTNQVSHVSENMNPAEREHIYLTLFLTLEPTLLLPQPFKGKVESRESEKLLSRVETLSSAFANAFPKRDFKFTVIDVQGKSVLICRFIRPMAPPEDVVELGGDIAVARFVSLIPLIPEVVVFPGQYDIWTTSDKFMEMLVGDHNEHAVLLCNYFLYLKKEAWMIIGFVVPEGRSVYVLSKEANDVYYVWNPCSGERFNVKDCFCPVQSVGCVINQHNVWLNLQRTSKPANLFFDFGNSRRWRSLFDHGFPCQGLSSLQPETLVYKPTDSEFIEKLEKKIESYLKSELMRWRRRFRTSWNRHCSQTLKKILMKMEKSRFWSLEEENEAAEISEDATSQLQTILTAYKMNGFPLSMAYTDLESVSEAIYVKGVHLAEGENIEFALAVHLHPYPNNVVALWIYLATLQKR